MKNAKYLLKIALFCTMIFTFYYTFQELIGSMKGSILKTENNYSLLLPQNDKSSLFPSNNSSNSNVLKNHRTAHTTYSTSAKNTINYKPAKFRKQAIEINPIASGGVINIEFNSDNFNKSVNQSNQDDASTLPNLAFNSSTRPIYANIFKSKQDSRLTITEINSASIFSDASLASNNSIMQRTGGYIDPSGDPTGDPIPVGEGMMAMFGFLGVYLVVRNFGVFFRHMLRS